MSDLAVSFEQLGHAYVPGKWIFREYSAGIERGSVFALLGPNGRGKTTLLKLLLGVLTPVAGRLELRGQAAFVPQLFQVSFDYSVLDMVLMGRARHVGLFSQPTRRDEQSALAALERFDLGAYAQRSFHELSGGQRQMVILARALVAEADILILDEPTSALDLRNQALVLDWIARLSREDGLTILFTTHHPHHALAVADVAFLMHGEQEFAFGPAAAVMTEENLLRLYGRPLKRLTFQYGDRWVDTLVPVFTPRAPAP